LAPDSTSPTSSRRIRQNDRSVERAAAYLELPTDRIEACLRYYADYGDEIDEWIDRAQAITEREGARWRRRGEALA
jgi:Lhr-like helicase